MEEGEESARDVMLQLLVKDGTAADPQEAEEVLEGMTTLEKRAYLGQSRSAEEIGLMKTLKSALDPKNILNPGKVI